MLRAIEYMYVMLANCCGRDKVSWRERITFAANLVTMPKEVALLECKTKEIPMFNKYWDILQHKTVFEEEMVSLDCTASGLQLFSLLTGCKKTALATNVIGSNINDAYTLANEKLEVLTGKEFTRKQVKDAVMPTFYGSEAEPKKLLGEENLEAYYSMLEEEFPGACLAMEAIQDSWRSDQDYHQWYLPDEFHVYIPIEKVVEYEIDIPEWGVKVPYRETIQAKQDKGISLAANVIQSIDAYVVREVITRADFPVWPIHDCFTVHAKNANDLRRIITDVYRDIARSDLLSDIIGQIRGDSTYKFNKLSTDLVDLINDENYIIC